MNTIEDKATRNGEISRLEEQLTEAQDSGEVEETIQLRIRLGQRLLEEGKAPQALTHFNHANRPTKRAARSKEKRRWKLRFQVIGAWH